MEEVVVAVKPGIYIEVYEACILGWDKKMCFKRQFLPQRRGAKETDGFHYTLRNRKNGVYEFCARYLDRKTHEKVDKRQFWYLVWEGQMQELSRQEVLFAIFNLRAQQGLSMPALAAGL
ncbi:MAG: hypothetical protein GXW99_07110 [Clostridiales bacterium]|nr:hypothetical protein [Clostridiales bacterium]